MSHTNEPWQVMPGRTLLHVESGPESNVAGEPVCSIPIKREADADRICACVNAMAGVVDPESWVRETREFITDLRDEVAALKARNAELESRVVPVNMAAARLSARVAKLTAALKLTEEALDMFVIAARQAGCDEDDGDNFALSEARAALAENES